jgi:HEAT repeat protein
MFKIKLNSTLTVLFLFVGMALSLVQDVVFADYRPEADLLAVLKSSASLKEKMDACRELAVTGSSESVSTLVPLLGDEQLSHSARYALETIQDPSVDGALRDALGKVNGRLLVGVIGSIGMRRDAKAVKPLAAFLKNEDDEIARIAARSLGKIGTPEAAKAIQSALADVSEANRLAFCEGLLHCAEMMAADGKEDAALKIYDRIREFDEPHQVRTAGLRGSVLLRGKKGLPILLEAVRSDHFGLVQAAARTALEMEGTEVTKALAADLEKLPAKNQIIVIQTLARRSEPAALPALFKASKSGQKSVRLAAIRSLPGFEDVSAMPVLKDLLKDSDREIAEAALAGLGALPGEEVDKTVIAMVNQSDSATRCMGIQLIGRRRMLDQMPTLLKTAEDKDQAVRIESLKVLHSFGGEEALKTVCTAISDPDKKISSTAVSLLSEWATVDAIPELWQLAKTSTDAESKALALRGLIRLIPQQEITPEAKSASLKEAIELASGNDEKRLGMAALKALPSIDNLTYVASFLTNADLKEDACAASVAIGEKVIQTDPAKVVDIMGKVLKSTTTEDLVKRAKALVDSQAKTSER